MKTYYLPEKPGICSSCLANYWALFAIRRPDVARRPETNYPTMGPNRPRAMPLTLDIVTPEGRARSARVDSLTLPTAEGEIGILPGHIPLMALLDAGEISLTRGGATEFLVVGPGYAEITGDRVRVLAEHAIEEDKIDPGYAGEAKLRAEQALRSGAKMTPEEVQQIEALLKFSAAELAASHRGRRYLRRR